MRRPDADHRLDLLRRWRDEGDLAARDALIGVYWGIAHHWAGRLADRRCPPEDLRQEALLALSVGLRRFDPAGNGNLDSYATIIIRRAILGALGADRRRRAVRPAVFADLDFEDRRYAGTVPDPVTGPDVERRAETAEVVGLLLRTLDARRRRAVELCLGLDGHAPGRTFKEAGILMGLTRERVRQIYNDACRTLRRRFGA